MCSLSTTSSLHEIEGAVASFSSTVGPFNLEILRRGSREGVREMPMKIKYSKITFRIRIG
jgi:hypothetical protein